MLAFALPDQPTRERLWRSLLPEGNARLDCALLAAESHGLGASRISGCIYQAAASLPLALALALSLTLTLILTLTPGRREPSAGGGGHRRRRGCRGCQGCY